MAQTHWAKSRKFLYTVSIVGFLVLASGLTWFKYFYEAPNCFDGKRNGSELGIDCGGNCKRLCESQVTPLVVKWSKFFKTRNGEYNIVAYVENPNRVIGVSELDYEFVFYDASGNEFEKITGRTYAAPNSAFPVFEGPIFLSAEPAEMKFDFIGDPYFTVLEDKEIPLKVESTTLMASETRPRLSALLLNDSIETLRDIDAVALIMDSTGEAIAASRTALRRMSRDERERIVFTWPESFKEEFKTCALPSTSVLAIDRSGSMQFDGKNPPQPLTDALAAAQIFVRNLSEDDRIGVVSYGTNSTIDLGISYDKNSALDTVKNLVILDEDEWGYTNIGAAIKNAHEEILSNLDENDERNVIVLLTDGVANWPQDPGGEVYAESQAALAKKDNITIYTIGLGEDLNRESLSIIATAPNYYFEAVTADDLAGIYREIGAAVCSYGPSLVEIIPRYNNVSTNR